MKLDFITPKAWQGTNEKQFHFYASSVAAWRTNENIEQLIKNMKKDKFMFTVWFIPLPETSHYKIENYTPIVEGRVRVGLWGDKKRLV